MTRSLAFLAVVAFLLAGCGGPQEPESWRASLDGYCHQGSLSWAQHEYVALAKDGATFRGPDWAEGNWKFGFDHQQDGLALTNPSLIEKWEGPRLHSVAWTDADLAGRLGPTGTGAPTTSFAKETAQLRATYRADTPEDQIERDLTQLLGTALGWTQDQSTRALAKLQSDEAVMFNDVLVRSYSLGLRGPFHADGLIKQLVQQGAIEPTSAWDGFGVRQLESASWSATVTIPVRHFQGEQYGNSILRVDAEGNVEFDHGHASTLRSAGDLWALARLTTGELDWPLPAWPPDPGYTSQVQAGCPDD